MGDKYRAWQDTERATALIMHSTPRQRTSKNATTKPMHDYGESRLSVFPTSGEGLLKTSHRTVHLQFAHKIQILNSPSVLSYVSLFAYSTYFRSRLPSS